MLLNSGQIPYDTTLSLPSERLAEIRGLCRATFKRTDGEPFDYGETQVLIIGTIAGRIVPRVQLILPTQFGKSEAVAQGVLLNAAPNPEKWAIVSVNQEKSEIIMGYVIQHIFDDPTFTDQLIIDEPLERLKQHKSKNHITFKNGGEIMTFSADARNRQRTKEAMMGFGAPNVVIDESALIDDDLYATIKRMVGGHTMRKDGTFILEIGNPFTRGHFLRTWIAGRYHRIWVDWQQAVAEGRYTLDFVEEMRDEAFFDVLYECHFPEGTEVRSDGYRRLLADATLENQFVEVPPPTPTVDANATPDERAKQELHLKRWLEDKPILGVDVAAGGENQTVFVLRYEYRGYSQVLEKNHDDDLDAQADRVVAYRRQYKVGDYRVAIDDGGVGHGLTSILRKRDILFKQVLFGESPHKDVQRRGGTMTPEQLRDRSRYANNRAMMFWRAGMWVKGGGLLVQDHIATPHAKDAGFGELGVISYKQNASDKLQIEPKEKMAERGIASPDTADAFALTFIDTGAIVEEDDIIDTTDDDDFPDHTETVAEDDDDDII